ncbi:MAG: WYL domain-containing protein [bacterium]|nr:WYL domain-containing protein [bacterium]MDE0287774.1 WYL domain-containing protein [bacterium]MDE0439309.1 WYL domain-containing protein [bacterium]
MSAVVERLINLLAFLLDSDRPVTAPRIRQKVAGYGNRSDQAFHRMFERDKDSLRRLGISMELQPTDAWEVEWGYVIPDENYRTIDPGLTEEERTALALAVHMVRSGGWPAGSDALLKLGGARFVESGTPVGADLGLGSSMLGLVFESVLDRAMLRFVYRGRSRTLAPYGMRHQRGHWYFAGAEPGHPDGARTYRLDRATEMEVVGPPGAFERPQDFSARDILSSLPWEQGSKQSVARVRWDPDVAWWAENRFPDARVVDRGPEGSMVMDIPYSVKDSFIELILDMDDAAVILDPPDLRAEIVRRVREDP